jgi:hypothetical protein
MFERGVILAPVADAVRGLLYSWQKKLTTSLHPQLFTQIRATKPFVIVWRQILFFDPHIRDTELS